MLINTQGVGTLIIIAVMTIVTLLTRWGGIYIMSYFSFTPRVHAFIKAMSGSVLVAIIAPDFLTGGRETQLALLTTALIMIISKRPMIAITAGVMVAVSLRFFYPNA